MNIDIIIITYNSSKWLKNCVNSIETQEHFDLNNIHLYFVDNLSTDSTIETLEKLKLSSNIKNFNILKTNKNLGFGLGNNYGAEKSSSEYIFFLNPDTELDKNALHELRKRY